MGPGPINADPRVLRAMATPLLGQFDPVMTECMNDTMALYRQVFRTSNDATVLVDGTSRAAIEACIVSLVEPGQRVLVLVIGRFGELLREIAERAGAEVQCLRAPWGEVLDPAVVAGAVEAFRPHLVATVQGDTSTTMCQPLADIGALCRAREVLLYADVTASIAGNAFAMDDWSVDAASAGLQKCLGGPSGSAPVSLSGRAVEVVLRRHSVEAGLRDDDAELEPDARIRSNYFDLGMILDYWGPRRLNHHTEATSMLYAARECGRILVDEGIDAAVARHRLHGEAMHQGVLGLGLSVFGDPAHRMHNVVGVEIPESVDGDAVRSGLLRDYAIEIGTSFGPLHGRIWRIGTMGYNARRDTVLTTLAALEQTLRAAGVAVPVGGGVDAAAAHYDASERSAAK
jgi:(S)-ureidoglycine-glyoxylate aminotransferase